MGASRTNRCGTYVALLRGINVGGNHMLPMKDLKHLFERHGCADVRTYIQSGNVVFRSPVEDAGALARRLSDAIRTAHGFEPSILVLTKEELARAAAGNPFSGGESNPKNVHLFFLTASPKKPDLAAAEAAKAPSERFLLKGRVFYLHTPDGFGVSKLAGRVERILGVPTTARNWRTVTTLLEMAEAVG